MNNLKEFFSFSKKELNGLLVFAFLIVLIAFAPLIYSSINPPRAYDFSAFEKEIRLFRASAREKPRFKRGYEIEDETGEKVSAANLFNFNPNNLPLSDWRKLGLSEKQIKVIKNFESKGGRFYKKDDLKKIYSIKPTDYARLEPFIQIPEKQSFYKSDFVKRSYQPERRKLVVIDINTADSAQLESLNGVGAAFASRILKYRTRLGGFSRKEQLKEVYGLDSNLYQKLQTQLTLDPASIKKILINTATFEDLKRHPYLTFKQMNAIVKYRKQHGDFKSIEDLKPIAILNDDVLNKIAPYLSFEPR